ncbi:unnamed protein product [Didymodactylos carnosus]|uniref:Cytochrome c1, heme protein, mitochondrial n=1 Tax=Didymodactylos carnosus TaxID=1234261 RepID=A0A815FAD5_9BILA|nr:unnamed protein product [Didymodactylos carnosus]CAF4175412.1 unnamed protein product [Didymodactylos carnosus]
MSSSSLLFYRTQRLPLFLIIRSNSTASTTSRVQSTTKWKRLTYQIGGSLVAVGTLGYCWARSQALLASSDKAHPAQIPWTFNGPFSSLDHAAIRRGFEVYKQVCAACHSMKFLQYRHLVGVCYTEDDAKKEAADNLIEDGPDDDGLMFTRPGKLTDHVPPPYKNDKAAKAANNGALPPDLSLISLGRGDGPNYIFSLLTGYQDPPAGVKGEENLHYNPYFGGGWIAMAKQLYDDQIEYTDGTKATETQLAADVVSFLKWSAEREHDDRKKMAVKGILIFAPLCVLMYHWKRVKWASIKSRKIAFYKPPSKYSE